MTENKITKSKYFQFITDDIVESQIISYNGTIIPLPKDWSYRKVKVVFNDSISQEMYVKDNGNISYITVAKIYLGTSATVSLLPQEPTKKPQENNNNNDKIPNLDSFISNTLKNMATSAICLSLSIYIFAIIT